MFRMGGSPQFEFQEQTSGVLSGLDGPKLNASRTGLANGGNPNKDVIFPPMSQQMIDMGMGAGGGRDMSGIESLNIVEDETETSGGGEENKTDKASRLEELFEEQMRIGKKFAADDEGRKAGMPGSLSSALMTFGLNLLGQPGGNLAGAIGKAGAPALSKFQAAREAERLDKRKAERDIKRDAFDAATDIFKAKIEADADIKSGAGKKGFEFKEKFDLIIQTQGEIQSLQAQLDIEEDPDKKKQIQNSIAAKQKGLENITEDDPFLAGFYKTEYFGDQIDQAAGELEVELGRPPTTNVCDNE